MPVYPRKVANKSNQSKRKNKIEYCLDLVGCRIAFVTKLPNTMCCVCTENDLATYEYKFVSRSSSTLRNQPSKSDSTLHQKSVEALFSTDSNFQKMLCLLASISTSVDTKIFNCLVLSRYYISINGIKSLQSIIKAILYHVTADSKI